MRKPRTKEPSAAEVERFAAGADGGTKSVADMDPDAVRNYKGVHLKMNKFEYTKLVELAKNTGRTRMGSIRWAIVKMADMDLDNNED